MVESNIVLNLKDSNGNPRVAGEDLVEGDILYIYTDGTLKKNTSAKAKNCVGICQEARNEGQTVPVLVQGEYTVRVLVEDTDSSSGYDRAIVAGDQLVISGKAEGTYPVGQALSAVGGTGVATSTANGEVVGKALEAVAGSDEADTYTTIKALVNFIN